MLNHDWLDEQVAAQRREEEAFEAGFRAGRRTALPPEPYEVEVERLNVMLQAAVARCRYAFLGLCDAACPARDYCLPETRGLEVLE